MNLRYVVSCGLACAALVLTGCDEGRPAPGRVTVQVANAAPGFESLAFVREQDSRNQATLSFRGANVFNYDADTYDFHVVDVADARRTWTFTPTLAENKNYTFVLTEVAGEVQPVVIEQPAAPAADSQILALNAAGGLPAMDLYIEPAGVGIAGATRRGSFAAQEQIAPFTLTAGAYEVWLTAAGNPADVLLASESITLQGGTTTLVVVPEGGQGTVPLSVMMLQPIPVLLLDRNAPSELRVINAATDQVPRDVAIDSQFSPPLFSATQFGEPTAYASVPKASMKINVTPVGDPGVLEAETTYSGIIGQRATMLFNGTAGTLVPLIVGDDGRRLNGQGKVRFMSAISTQTYSLDFVVTFPDGDPNNLFSLAALFAPGISGYTSLSPGDYDLYVRQTATTTYMAGPIRFSVAAGGLYGVLAVDGPDTATVTVLMLDDFP